MSIESILSGITGIESGGKNTAAEFRTLLTDMTVTLSGETLDEITDRGNTTDNEVKVGSLSADSITFPTIGSGVWAEGKVEWDNVHKTLKMYTDEPDIAMQMGQEMWMRVYNNTGSPILNGKVVTVVGVTPEGVPHIDLAISSIKESANNSVGFTTHEIESGTYGYVTTRGFVHDVDTTAAAEGALIFLSAEFAGEVTDVRPSSPNYEIKVGGIAKSGTTDGIFYVEMLVLNNLQGIAKFYNGSILEHATVLTESDGVDVTFTLDNVTPGDPLSLIFDENFYVMEQPQTVILSGGTNSDPIPNYVYVPKSTKLLTISQIGFPINEQFIPVATLMVQSAPSVQTYGPYKLQLWIDDLSNEHGVGHLTNINSFIRQSFPRYKSGNDLTLTESGSPYFEGDSVPRIDLAYSPAVISQLHFHLVPGYDTSVNGGINSPIFVINELDNEYKVLSGLTSADLQNDSNGVSLADKYYIVVIWGTFAENYGDSKMFMNLPNGNYTQLSDAISDVDSTANFSIPRDYSGSGYLMSKFILKNSGGNIEIAIGGITSLLGLIPNVGAGGGVTSGPIITGVGANAIIISAKANETILKGQVVYIDGASGGIAEIALADNTDFTKSNVLAVATESGSIGQTILVTTNGMLEDFNTNSWNGGDILYLSSGGTMTNEHPSGIDAVIRIGTVINKHINQGSMIINIDSLTIIKDHNDVIRYQLVNQSGGDSASVAYTMVNDLNQRSSISMLGSNYVANEDVASSLFIYNEGYARTISLVDGNHGFVWATDETDSHVISGTSKMELSASGVLTVPNTISGGTIGGDVIMSGGTNLIDLIPTNNIIKVGDPINEQVAVWTGNGTIEGSSNVSVSGAILSVGDEDVDYGTLNLYGNGIVGGNLIIHNGTAAQDDDNQYNIIPTNGVLDFSGSTTGTFLRYTSATEIVELPKPTVISSGYTVTTLPAGEVGMRAYVTDSNVVALGNFGVTVADGGLNTVPVFFDGTNWIIA